MKKFRRFLGLLLLLGVIACDDNPGAFLDAVQQREQSVASIAFSTHEVRMPVGAAQQIPLVATDFDGNQSTYTGAVTWISASPAVATVSDGLVDAVAAGTSRISATVGAASVSADIEVYSTVLTALTFTPNPLTANECAQGNVEVRGTYTDGANFLLIPPFAFSAPANVVVTDGTANAAVHAQVAGSYTVPLTEDGVTASVTLEAADNLSSVTLDTSSVSLAVAGTQQLTATGTFSDGSTSDISGLGTWTLQNASPTDVLALSSTAPGFITANNAGSGTVRFACGGLQADASVVVDPASVLQRIAIGDGAGEIDMNTGTTQALVLTAHYADGSSVVVTEQASWSVSLGDTAAVSVSDTAGSKGTVTAAAGITSETSAIVEASYETFSTLVRVFVARN